MSATARLAALLAVLACAACSGWAQAIGELLPLTHFLRIVRGIMLKGSMFGDLWAEAGAIAAFVAVMGSVAMLRYRQTLD